MTKQSALGCFLAASVVLHTPHTHDTHQAAGRASGCTSNWPRVTTRCCPADKAQHRTTTAIHAACCRSCVWAGLQRRSGGCAVRCLGGPHLPYTGMAISSSPKKTFWKPPLEPGCTMQATEGVVRPAETARAVQPVAGGTLTLPPWHSTAWGEGCWVERCGA